MIGNYLRFYPNGAPHSLPLPQTSVYHNLEVSAERYPDKAAIVYYGTEVTYGRLKDEAEKLAGYLQDKLGVEKGDRVVLYMQNCPQFMVAFYAILRADAVVVPVNPMLVTTELSRYFEDSGARVAVVGEEVYEHVSPLLEDTPLEHVVSTVYSDYLEEPTDLAVPEDVSAAREVEGAIPWGATIEAGLVPRPHTASVEDLACLPYTSGTTGGPKGCMHTNGTLHATIDATVVWNGLNSNDIGLATLPFFHVAGMQVVMNAAVYAAGTLILLSRWNRDMAAELIQRHGVTFWVNIPTMVVDFLANPGIRNYDLSSLRLVGGGGAALPAAVGEQLEEVAGLRYQEGYGLTETMSQTHANPPDRAKLQCLGVPLFDVDARVVGTESLEDLGPGEVGEIALSAPQVMKGYWGRPDADEEAFIERDKKRFLRTGDIGTYDEEGYFFMVDRLKRMINASGYNVWPAEVETILYEHPAVQEACVVGVPDDRRGETTKAFVVLREEQKGKVKPVEIIEWSKERMAAYKYPRFVEFVDTLPKSASGKILWRKLEEAQMKASRT